jgi:molecular chaperone GrpE (heat shock protein)
MHATDSFPSQPVTGESERPVPPGAGSDATLAEARPPSENPSPDTLGATGPDAAAAGPGGDRLSALRALRNLEATEARLARNARRELDDARGKLVQELLPVLDNLDRTIRAAHAARSEPGLLEGVRLVRHQLEAVLRGYGVERIEALDQRFDPNLHEAIGVAAVADPRRHGVVVQQAEPGYRLGDRLLRPAKVSVGKLVAPIEAAPRTLWR